MLVDILDELLNVGLVLLSSEAEDVFSRPFAPTDEGQDWVVVVVSDHLGGFCE